jgi:hypothetical protein
MSVAKTWWDSRVNLAAGVVFLLGLTVLYYFIRPNQMNGGN